MMLAGLMLSSTKKGSRTDMGLGRPVLSISLSICSAFEVIGELDGDANGEDKGSLSSNDSWKNRP